MPKVISTTMVQEHYLVELIVTEIGTGIFLCFSFHFVIQSFSYGALTLGDMLYL